MRLLAVVVLAAVPAGCSSAEPTVEASSPAAPEPAAPSSPAEPAVETSSPAEPVAPSSAPAAAADEPETLTAAEAIAAIQAAGLPVGEVRDNTNGNCPTIGCEALIRTDYVSAYQWPSPEDAAENESFGPGRERVSWGGSCCTSAATRPSGRSTPRRTSTPPRRRSPASSARRCRADQDPTTRDPCSASCGRCASAAGRTVVSSSASDGAGNRGEETRSGAPARRCDAAPVWRRRVLGGDAQEPDGAVGSGATACRSWRPDGGSRRASKCCGGAPTTPTCPAGTVIPTAVAVVVFALVGVRLGRTRRRNLDNIARAVERHPVVTVTVGTLLTLTALSLTVFMAFTLVLIPVSILGLVAGAALTALGVIAWGHRLGRHLPWQRPGTATAVGVAAVVVVLHLVGTIPVVGDLIVGFVVLSGLGAVSVTYLGFDDSQPAALPAETPDTASRSPATTSEPEPSVAAAARSTSVHRVRSSCARSSVLAR